MRSVSSSLLTLMNSSRPAHARSCKFLKLSPLGTLTRCGRKYISSIKPGQRSSISENNIASQSPKLSSRKRLSTVIGVVRSPRMTSAVTKARLKSLDNMRSNLTSLRA